MFNFIKNEEQILQYWKEMDILQKTRALNKGNKTFFFLDGPPYSSGYLHPGQIWVKSIKDIYIRFRRLQGFDVHDKAGYDVHGLPIENKVEKTLELTSKKDIEIKIGVENFTNYCKEYVTSLIPSMTKDFIRFGASLDFEKPYLAYENSFIESAWDILKKINEKGLLYSGVKPMLYCTHCGTVLAQGTLEVEYSDETDNSIFVEFKINKELSKPKIEVSENTYFLIWTTTPWTLPSNIAIAINPKELYVKVKMNNKSLIFMKSRLEYLSEISKDNFIIEAEFYGSELEGLFYINPLENKIPKQKELRNVHKVVSAETLVSSQEGSGIVHIAPGHGLEDYQIGLKNNLPIFSPIDLSGNYNNDSGSYVNLKVPEQANLKIIDDLKSINVLFGNFKVKHSYPHCWRCKEKLLFLVTKQWFFNIQKIKNKLIAENKKVLWHPEEAKSWMEDVLTNSPDWSITRQRYWGIPIPIWHCSSCNTDKIIGSKEELVSNSIDKEKANAITNLHKPFIDQIKIKCEKCGDEASRISDVFDVWYDSGIAFKASLSQEEFDKLFPADFILEGKDQLRGWFSTLLKISVMLYGKAPFKNVVIDGMLLSDDGREMHKSLGNYISLEELLKITSADGYRLWCSSHTQWLDLQFKKDEMKESEKKIGTLYNMFNLFNEYTSLTRYIPTKIKKPNIKKIKDIEDLWILSRFSSTLQVVTEALTNYKIQIANNSISNFLLNDLSRFYLKIFKKKILFAEKSKAKYYVDLMNYILYNLNVMISPFTPFSSEYLYLEVNKKMCGDKESIFLNTWPKLPKDFINLDLEKDFSIVDEIITGVLNSREQSGIKLRWPVSKVTIETTYPELESIIAKFNGLICDYTNVKEITLKKVESVSIEIKPNFSKIGPEFKDKSTSVSEALKTEDYNKIRKELSAVGYYILHTEKGPVQINETHFTVIEKLTAENGVKFKYGFIYIDSHIDQKLKYEALVREFERRVQLLRKENSLKKQDKIELFYSASGELREAIDLFENEIMNYVNAKKMYKELSNENLQIKEFEIEGEKLVIQIKTL